MTPSPTDLGSLQNKKTAFKSNKIVIDKPILKNASF